VVDVLAGLALAFAVVPIADRLYDRIVKETGAASRA
jgi:hypothetical protein